MRALQRWAAAGATVAAMTLGLVGSAGAMEISSFEGEFVDPVTGEAQLQAGAHPDYRIRMFFPDKPGHSEWYPLPEESVRTIEVTLPPGLVGNPATAPKCPQSGLRGPSNAVECPIDAQIGLAKVYTSPDREWGYEQVPVYNLERPADKPGEFGFNFFGALVRFAPLLRAGDYRVVVEARDSSQAKAIFGIDLKMWGVPADPLHDPERYMAPYQYGGPSTAPRRPFMTSPTQCTGSPLITDLRVDSWQNTGVFGSASFGEGLGGDPLVMTGCEKLGFLPAVDATPTSRAADAPSGLDVDLQVPQNDHPDGLATAHVKDVTMVLPEGVSVSPASAAGLGACSSAEIDLASNAAPDCPRSSKLGTVTVHTPVLDVPMTGDVILATPDDNPFGSLIALYIVAEGPGVRLKLPGRVDADPVTGRLTATFANNPQLPFSSLQVRFDRGENASLATPTACGTYETRTEVTSWSGKSVDLVSPMVVDEGCGPRGFAPSFIAGTENPVAGGSSPFSLTIDRPDRTAELSTLSSLKLPKGLLGHVSKVDVCPDAAADAGTCGAGSRIGHVQVAAGPGGSPVWVPERGKAPTSVSLAGPYKGAPYSLSVVVPAQAGPFDLGRVVARSPLHLDRRTAQLSTGIDVSRVFDRKGNLTQTVQGAMPTIVEGIPLRLRELRVIVDRDGFTVNPTSCAPASVDATLRSTDGQTREVGSRFQVGECAALGFSPRLGMRLLGKRQTKTGRHPALRTVLTQPDGQANIGSARVVMPRSIVLDPENSVDPALVCDYDVGEKGECDADSVIGRARAVSPLLKKPLTGTVPLVQGIRFGPTGNRIRSTPSLLVKLRGEVDIDLHGRTTVHAGRLVTVFKQVPDARVKRFALRINGGRKGILVVTGSRRGNIDICDSRQTANLRFVGHNGKRTSQRQLVRTPCGKAGNKANAGKKAKGGKRAKAGKRNTGKR